MFFENKRRLADFRRRILSWYSKNLRSLPWRGTADPYRIWVSEIMLQQTTTQTVKGYFGRFIERFPTVRDLASAPSDEVRRLWEGLGYYRRCDQMCRAAREIVDRYGGVFPSTYRDVLALPGIGRYTAGAVLSIAFDRRLPILEANTIRLHARILALEESPVTKSSQERLWSFAETILPTSEIGRFNQALMDLGSMICTPKNPKCGDCPIVSHCEAARKGIQEILPLSKPRQEKVDRTEVAVLVRKKRKILMIRYPEGVRWAGRWDFPRAESQAEIPLEIHDDRLLHERLSLMTGRRLQISSLLETVKHVVTRFRITLYFCDATDLGAVRPKDSNSTAYEIRWADPSEIDHLPLHSSARILFERTVQNR